MHGAGLGLRLRGSPPPHHPQACLSPDTFTPSDVDGPLPFFCPGTPGKRNAQMPQGLTVAPPVATGYNPVICGRSCHAAKNYWTEKTGKIGPAPSFIILIRNSPRGDVICPKSCNFLEPETNRKISMLLFFPLLSGYLGAPGFAFERERRGRPGSASQ